MLLSLGAFLLQRWRNTQSSSKLLPKPVPIQRSASPQSGNLSAKSRREPETSSDETSVEHPESVTQDCVVQEANQTPPEENMRHASTSRAMNDEAVAEILRLNSQIQQLIAERAAAYREPDPPPAYAEDFSR
ncbi:hypothetical protein IW261DRAFT_1423906 [Armillaria novae-zelandiae]|nr:hypothetical protein IW261DRAFT_1423906 [Armillaria novae-zelandiae]